MRPSHPPVRLAHLGLGNFFRAHQAWYTDRAPDADQWGIAAFAGRGDGVSARLAAQDCRYTLVTRDADTDRFTTVRSISAAHAGTDHQTWLATFAAPALAAVTITVTEAGYCLDGDGRLDRDRMADEAGLLRRDPGAAVRSAPARLVAGLAARRRADAGPLTLVPCDNLAGNGDAVRAAVGGFAALVDSGLAGWIEQSVAVATTVVDRITPRTEPADISAVEAATGVADACPVVTEPFAEWVISGDFPAGRPAWDAAGAAFTADVTPFEHRKLWLLNGAHSLLAYAGSLRGHETVAGAIADDRCRDLAEQWWTEAARGIPLEVSDYRHALLGRFGNPRIRHRLAQIAADGSQKLPVRVLPTLRVERAAGRDATAASFVLGAWLRHLRGDGAPVDDVRAADLVPLAAGPLPDAARRVLDLLAPGLADDQVVVDGVVTAARSL